MAKGAVAQGILTFVFTDIVGSTKLWERVPQAAGPTIARHNDLVHAAVVHCGGSVFKVVGDACCCVFHDAPSAVAAAVAIQRAIANEPWPEQIGALRVRIGIHSGTAMRKRNDYVGATLNRVARLTSAGHGGQILVSDAAASLAGDGAGAYALRDLGSHRLKDLAEPQPIFQVVADALEREFPAPRTLDAHPNNLPSQLSTFVGRELELEALRRLFARERLVTICGPGGIGKTRLALQIAAENTGNFNGGAWLVRLADVSEASLVPHALASVLHVVQAPGSSIEDALVDALRSRSCFVILDNAEHVLDAAATIARRLLADCPNLVMLATSREPLHLTGEAVLRIGSMQRTDAVRLFEERAHVARGIRHVERICERVDGVPLSIELAAARIGTLTVEQLDGRLDAILPVLASKDASQEARHRSLQATIDWSYRLLDESERKLFAALSTFDAGCTLEACEAVAPPALGEPVLGVLDALVDKSFVVAEPDGPSMRYRMLEALHEFARVQLDGSGDAYEAQRRHYAHFRAVAECWGTWSSVEEEQSYLAAFEREIPNVRAAMAWALGHAPSTQACEFLLRVASYWQQHCNVSEARAWFARALEMTADERTDVRARMLRRAATFATIENDFAQARLLTQQARELFEALGDRRGAAEALHNLAVIEHESGSEDEAYRLYAQALDGFEQTGHLAGRITALYNLAQTAVHRGDYAAAASALERGKVLCGAAEHADKLASFLWLSGDLAMRRGALDDARRTLEDALAMKRRLHDRFDEGEILHSLAALHIRAGELDRANAYAQESVQLARTLNIASLLVGCLEVFAVLFAKTARESQAELVLAVANALRRERGYVYSITNELAAELAAIRPADVDAGVSDLPHILDELCAVQGVL